MIVLDTNVLSELLRPRPDPAVVERIDGWLVEELVTTAITAAELLHGVARLPAGRRRDELAAGVHSVIREDFDGRVVPFDIDAAGAYAVVVAAREAAGRPIQVADAQIAAICRVHDATLVTRNIVDFVATGVALLDPWRDG